MSEAKYLSTYTRGEIKVVNADGTYDVCVKGRGSNYASIASGNAEKYTVGDSVNILFAHGDRNMPTIMGYGCFSNRSA